MEHILDNPVWKALITGNKALANGESTARYLSPEVSPFVGIESISDDNFNALNTAIPFAGYFGFVAPYDIVFPAPWQVVQPLKVLQMVYEGLADTGQIKEEFISLDKEHVPQMLALTKLTNPGPFAERTMEFGHYVGIFDGDKLVAMAGQRMNPVPYAEISAVCTHPDYLGRGYASQLLLFHINRIKTAGQIPFLHVKADNDRAIQVYERLGFVKRKEMSFYIIKKD